MNNWSSRLKEKRVLLWSIILLAAPAIIEMALNTMLSVVDTILLGRLIGSSAIAAVGFANQIMYFLIFTFSAFNTGAVAMISRAYGEKDYVKLKRIAQQNVLLNATVGILVMVAAYLSRHGLFKIYDIEPQIFNDAVTYFTYTIYGFIPMFLSFAFAAILRGAGDTKTPMYVSAVANALNIVGNFVLITGMGPFPEMGIAGSALATTLARWFAMSIYIYHLYIKNSEIKLKISWFVDRKIIEPLFRISLPGGIEQFLMQLSFVVAGIFISSLETGSEAVFRILIQIESLSFMPAVGISIAAATLVGKSLGEKDPDKASEMGLTSAFLGVLWGLFVAMSFLLMPIPMLKAFTTDPAVIALGVPVMIYMAINQPGLNFVIVMGGALRGAGDTYKLMIYTIIRLWVLFVPLCYLFIMRLGQDVAGLWQAEILSIFAISAVILKRFRDRKWAEIKVD